MPIYRVVLDTNVATSGLIGYGAIPRKTSVDVACIEAVRTRRVQLVTSTELLSELLEVLQRPQFGRDRHRARRDVQLLTQYARVVRVPGRLNVLKRDPDDNAVLETAIVGKADYLVTWNLQDFDELSSNNERPVRYRGVSIVEPSKLLEALRHSGN